MEKEREKESEKERSVVSCMKQLDATPAGSLGICVYRLLFQILIMGEILMDEIIYLRVRLCGVINYNAFFKI